ncbi:hypothetical protein V5O48_015185 [Marasmius crinis-equi]|uniref:Uncharacterized protein n=1 Tax=Marasmius crinis-equi TaxID=585013 RepID=A0ABR3EVJ3_9AGAR
MESFYHFLSLFIILIISTALVVLLWKQSRRESFYLNRIHDLMEYSRILEGRLTDKQKQYDDLRSSAAASHAKYIQLERHFLSNEEQYEQRCRRLEEENKKLMVKRRQHEVDITIQPLALFMERFLLMNKLWRQEREIARLQTSLADRDRNISGAAFDGFKDRLLLWNTIWRKQGEMRLVLEENARMKQNMVRSITKAAKKMVLDTRREGMIEEMMDELVTEIEDGKKEMKALKARHELEVQEINGDWFHDYRKLLTEIEALRLGKRARDIEQEITNDMEQRLVQAILASKAPSKPLGPAKATNTALVVCKANKKPRWR